MAIDKPSLVDRVFSLTFFFFNSRRKRSIEFKSGLFTDSSKFLFFERLKKSDYYQKIDHVNF